MSQARRRNAAIGWSLLIVAACSIPGTDLPRVDVEWIDKAAHIFLFAVLAWLWLGAGSSSLGKRTVAVILAGTVFGILTEIYQGLLPWERTPDMLDAVANTVGLIVGSAIFAARKTFLARDGSNL